MMQTCDRTGKSPRRRGGGSKTNVIDKSLNEKGSNSALSSKRFILPKGEEKERSNTPAWFLRGRLSVSGG